MFTDRNIIFRLSCWEFFKIFLCLELYVFARDFHFSDIAYCDPLHALSIILCFHSIVDYKMLSQWSTSHWYSYDGSTHNSCWWGGTSIYCGINSSYTFDLYENGAHCVDRCHLGATVWLAMSYERLATTGENPFGRWQYDTQKFNRYNS